MKAVNIIKKYLARASVYYLFLAAAYAAVSVAVDVDKVKVSAEGGTLIAASMLVYLFLFSVAFSFSGAIFEIKTMNPALRGLLHFAASLASYFAFLVAPANPSSAQSLIFAVLYTAVYLIYFGLKTLLKKRFKRLFEADGEYAPRFEKAKR